jgi:Ni/Fe-hydrogenase 1 B-type cytochrome subunit
LGDHPIKSKYMENMFNEPHSLAIRIWHWTFFLVLTASLVTVLFASTMFRTRNTIGLVQDQLQQKGVTVTKDQARAVAHEFSDRLWDLHTFIGYVLCGLLLIRIIIEVAQPREEKLKNKLRKIMGLKPLNAVEAAEKKHYIRVKTSYLVFYLLILAMALTGLGLAFEDNALLKEWHGDIKQVHSFVQYLIYAFILFHLVGVIRADGNRHKGLVSGMIHGKK